LREIIAAENSMANDKGPNIKKKQKCKVRVISTISRRYHFRFAKFRSIAFHSVSKYILSFAVLELRAAVVIKSRRAA
jgi:hypothetical protein